MGSNTMTGLMRDNGPDIKQTANPRTGCGSMIQITGTYSLPGEQGRGGKKKINKGGGWGGDTHNIAI